MKSRKNTPCIVVTVIVGMVLSLSVTYGNGRDSIPVDTVNKNPCFVGTSAFLLVNLLPDPPVYYGQLDFGYHLTPRDALIVELVVWKYASPMGNPAMHGPAYPGSVLAYGISFAYQRIFWKGIFTTVHFTPLITRYTDQSGKFIANGFQPWLQLRPGYHFDLPFFSSRLFVEPSLEVNVWPWNYNVPRSFKELDDTYPHYLIAPGLNFGFRF